MKKSIKEKLKEGLLETENTEIKLTEEFGGKGEFTLPSNHKAGMKVPKGGSSCANCKFLSKDGKHCVNEHWVKWNGGDSELPFPADEYCSDWYEPNE